MPKSSSMDVHGPDFQFRAFCCSEASHKEGPHLVALPARGAVPSWPNQSSKGAGPAPRQLLGKVLAAEGKRAGRSSQVGTGGGSGPGGGHRSRPFPHPAEDAVIARRAFGLLRGPPELFAPRAPLDWPQPGAGGGLQEGEWRKRRRRLCRVSPALWERPTASAERGSWAPVPGPGEQEGRPLP